MRKFLSTISILLLLSSITSKLNAEVITEIGKFRMCYNTAQAMPVVVQNFTSIDTFNLVLTFDKNAVDFVEHFAVNQALTPGVLKITKNVSSIEIYWTNKKGVTLSKDTLFWLKFKGKKGTTSLSWKKPDSYFHSTTGNPLSIFVDGDAETYPKISTVITEIDPTCISKDDANYMANASGGLAPFSYKWNGKPGRFDSIQTNLRAGKNYLSIFDSRGCQLDTSFVIKGLPGANVKLIIEGNEDTTIYLQNPVLTFRFEEISPTHVTQPPLWEFGDGDTARSFNPTHLFAKAITSTKKSYTLRLHIANENGCDTIIEFILQIKEAKLKIPGVITPNGDSFNDSFIILNQNKTGSGEDTKITTEFQRMELIVFDRWGRKIYDDSNYQSNWFAKGVPDGSYYFKLRTVGFYRTDDYKGSLTILGSGVSQ